MSTKFIKTLDKLIRARSGLLWARTNEEARAETLIKGVAQRIQFNKVLVWRCSTGLVNQEDPSDNRPDLAVMCKSPFAPPQGQPDGVLEFLGSYSEGPALVIMEDMADHLGENSPTRVPAMRLFKDLSRKSQGSTPDEWVQVVVVDRNKPVDGFISVELDLPTRAELQSIVEGMAKSTRSTSILHGLLDAETDEDKAAIDADLAKNKIDPDRAANSETFNRVLDALLGLEDQQAQQAVAVSLAEKGCINPEVLIQSKKALISSPAVKWIDPNPKGMDAIGGLDNLKEYLMITYQTFLDAQRFEFTPRPQGIVIAGVPGTGKSHTAKCVGTAWGLPLVQLSMGALMGKYLGDSEQGWFKARDVVEAIAPCILWIDEIEKGFSGFSGGGDSDGGTSRRIGQDILNWLQDCDKQVYIVATSNDPMALDAEFLRAGRFDDQFWVDVPNTTDRIATAKVVSSKYKSLAADEFVNKMDIDWAAVAKGTVNFTGAELEQAVINAIKRTNYEKRVLTTEDIVEEAKQIRPVVDGWGDGKLAKQRKWGEGARQAAKAEKKEKGAAEMFRPVMMKDNSSDNSN
jgi:ATP-dependent 26S proteasome regulatory subunit